MSDRDKNKFIKEFNDVVSKIYASGIKQSSTNANFAYKSKEAFKEYTNLQAKDKRAELRSLLSADVLHAYQSRNNIITFGFYFPDAFTDATCKDYDELASKVEISIRIRELCGGESQGASRIVRFAQLQDIAKKLSFFSKLYEQTNADKQHMRSPQQVWLGLFRFIAFTGDDSLYEALLSNNDKVEVATHKCCEFVTKRAQVNRAKKNAKKQKNKAETDPRIIENQRLINDLESQIRQLKSENELIKKETNGETKQAEDEGELGDLMVAYQLSIRELVSSKPLHRASMRSDEANTVFLDIFKR